MNSRPLITPLDHRLCAAERASIVAAVGIYERHGLTRTVAVILASQRSALKPSTRTVWRWLTAAEVTITRAARGLGGRRA